VDRHVEAWFTHLDALWKIRTGVGLIPMSRPTLRVHTAFRRTCRCVALNSPASPNCSEPRTVTGPAHRAKRFGCGGARLLIRCQPGSVRSTQRWIESASELACCALRDPGLVGSHISGRAGASPASRSAANSGDTRVPVRRCSSAGSQARTLPLWVSIGSLTLLRCCGPSRE
jgi:hypothetical protein